MVSVTAPQTYHVACQSPVPCRIAPARLRCSSVRRPVARQASPVSWGLVPCTWLHAPLVGRRRSPRHHSSASPRLFRLTSSSASPSSSSFPWPASAQRMPPPTSPSLLLLVTARRRRNRLLRRPPGAPSCTLRPASSPARWDTCPGRRRGASSPELPAVLVVPPSRLPPADEAPSDTDSASSRATRSGMLRRQAPHTS